MDNNNDQWDAKVEFFLRIGEHGVFFMTNPDNEVESWSVIKVYRYSDGRKYILVENKDGIGGRRTVDLEGFIAHAVLSEPKPEHVTSEVENLFDSLGDGDTFWTVGNLSAFIRWTFVSRGSGRISARHDLGDLRGMTYCWDVERLAEHNATATRPKTDREVDLEEQVEEIEEDNKLLRAFNSGDIAAVKQAESRVKELEGDYERVVDAIAAMSAVIDRALRQDR